MKSHGMSLGEQIGRLYKIQEQLRELQSAGLWEPLHNAKGDVIRLIKSLEATRDGRILEEEVNKLIMMSYDAEGKEEDFATAIAAVIKSQGLDAILKNLQTRNQTANIESLFKTLKALRGIYRGF
jgi:hypothetical protein